MFMAIVDSRMSQDRKIAAISDEAMCLFYILSYEASTVFRAGFLV